MSILVHTGNESKIRRRFVENKQKCVAKSKTKATPYTTKKNSIVIISNRQQFYSQS